MVRTDVGLTTTPPPPEPCPVTEDGVNPKVAPAGQAGDPEGAAARLTVQFSFVPA